MDNRHGHAQLWQFPRHWSMIGCGSCLSLEERQLHTALIKLNDRWRKRRGNATISVTERSISFFSKKYPLKPTWNRNHTIVYVWILSIRIMTWTWTKAQTSVMGGRCEPWRDIILHNYKAKTCFTGWETPLHFNACNEEKKWESSLLVTHTNEL